MPLQISPPTRSKRRPAPRRYVRPMLATLVEQPFDRDDWFFEIKWDGYRAIADVEDGRVALYSRRQEPFEAKFAPIVEALSHLEHDVILDGEVVVLDEEGKPSFQDLQNYQKTRRGQLVYYVFDILSLDGEDLRHLPLARRKQFLTELELPDSRLRVSEHIEHDGVAFFQAAVEQGLEGVVAKSGKSPYREGLRSYDWLKIKSRQRQEAVIAGFTRPRGSRQGFGALILGVYENDELTYVGHTGGGFNTKTLLEMHAQLKKLSQPKCPFRVRPKTNAPATWVEPTLVCEVEFHNWSSDGIMRQPIFVGLRTDKAARDVHRELPQKTKKAIENA